MKPEIRQAQLFKKLRSRLPRRGRLQISRVLCKSVRSIVAEQNKGSVAISEDSSGSSHLAREVSCDSSRVSVGSHDLKINKPKPSAKKRGFEEISGCKANEKVPSEDFRRVTRLYCRRRENERKGEKRGGDGKVELSESSCVESCSRVDARSSSKLSTRTGKGAENAKEIRGIERSEPITQSEISSVQSEFSRKVSESRAEKLKENENSSEVKGNLGVSVSSGLESPSEAKFGSVCSYRVKLSGKTIKDGESRVSGDELSEVSRSNTDPNFTILDSKSSEQKTSSLPLDSDLACSEHFSNDDVSDYSSVFSELQSEIFAESSDLDFSDYTPSIWLDSGSQFSEQSAGDATPSPTFLLLLQYREQFCRSTCRFESDATSHVEDQSSYGSSLSSFESDEQEDNYQLLRDRERKQVYLHDYAEEYCSTTEYGKLIIQQRLQMVHWIVEQSATKDLQKETMFLGVSLLDRFLTKGFFKSKRNLQIAGIACLTLATRIEENQPLNSVRQNTFMVGSNEYNRGEVVAMEWLVQEILNFQCFLPTIYNFLWFYLKAARANYEVEKTANYLAVLVLLGHEQLCYWPSTVAAGLVILASLAANKDASCHLVMETHVRVKDDSLPACIKSMEWLVKYI